MDELSEILRVLLKRVPYEPFLNNELDCMAMEKKLLNKAIHSYVPYNSDTEVRYRIESLADSLEKYAEFFENRVHTGEKAVSVFDAIFWFSNAMLVKQNNEVMCRYERILRWRTTITDIGEEVFVTAFLAKRDLEAGRSRRYFSWPPVIGHNNIQLRSITRRGMAENHFHLWGSAPYFQLSWLRLMNELDNPAYMRMLDKIEDNLRTGYLVYDRKYAEKELWNSCYRAALIRLFLYAKLTDTMIELGEYYVEWTSFLPWISQFEGSIAENVLRSLLLKKQKAAAAEVLQAICETMECKAMEPFYAALYLIFDESIAFEMMPREGSEIALQDILYFLFRRKDRIRLKDGRTLLDSGVFSDLWWRETYHRVVYYLNHPEAYIRHADQIQSIIDSFAYRSEKKTDYALNAIDFKVYREQEIFYDLSGERYLMYEMFRHAGKRSRSLSPQIYNMFYAYLIIKEKIRGEFVQSNNWVGFENFNIYQSRKGLFLEGKKYEQMMAKMAVSSSFQQKVALLEIRISPQSTVRQNYEFISFLDHTIDPEKKMRDKFFYVFHFIKRPDTDLAEDRHCECRHSALRISIRQKARALIEFRQTCPQTAARVFGIDAAAQEIGCRPEVFAQIFRTLQNDMSVVSTEKGIVRMQQLRATYHVGEEFLDVTDGLRAIDEAVLFLDLDCGDRIGHGLALGICVRDWYKAKRYRISLKCQDYLDNLVWLYHAIIRYRIYCLDNLKNRLEAEFQKYFSEIFRKHMGQEYIAKILKESGQTGSGGNLNFDIHTYYDAWKLRGDDPELYRSGYYKRRPAFSAFDVYAVNRKYPPDFDMRYRPEPAMINYYYHYDMDVRKAGNVEVEIKITEDYIKGIELVQKAMQKEIAVRGIGIETNPTSNYLIGTFRRYDEHPITRFYNNGLTFDSEKLANSPQIWTSINTDDQGVFCTTLENEYALLARALEKKKDQDGVEIYQKTMIYNWLNKIRKMGFSQSFYGGMLDPTTSEKENPPCIFDKTAL